MIGMIKARRSSLVWLLPAGALLAAMVLPWAFLPNGMDISKILVLASLDAFILFAAIGYFRSIFYYLFCMIMRDRYVLFSDKDDFIYLDRSIATIRPDLVEGAVVRNRGSIRREFVEITQGGAFRTTKIASGRLEGGCDAVLTALGLELDESLRRDQPPSRT